MARRRETRRQYHMVLTSDWQACVSRFEAWKLCLQHHTSQIEVRDSRTGYFIPVRYGMGVWPDGKIVGAPPPSPSASPGNHLEKVTLTVLVFGPKSISYERTRRETAAKFHHISSATLMLLLLLMMMMMMMRCAWPRTCA